MHLVVRQNPGPADAVVILEGEYDIRIDYALDLVDKEFTRLILYPALNLGRNKARINEWLQKHSNEITFLHDSGASSTYEEAIRTRAYCREYGVQSLLLVTSTYHSYRAWWIFKKVLPGVKVISAPIPDESDWFKPEEAIKESFAREVFRREQFKFAVYYFLYGWRWY